MVMFTHWTVEYRNDETGDSGSETFYCADDANKAIIQYRKSGYFVELYVG